MRGVPQQLRWRGQRSGLGGSTALHRGGHVRPTHLSPWHARADQVIAYYPAVLIRILGQRLRKKVGRRGSGESGQGRAGNGVDHEGATVAPQPLIGTLDLEMPAGTDVELRLVRSMPV